MDINNLLRSEDSIRAEACLDKPGWRVLCGEEPVDPAIDAWYKREAEALMRVGDLETWRNQARALQRKQKLAARDQAMVEIAPTPVVAVAEPEIVAVDPPAPEVARAQLQPADLCPVLDRTGDV